MRNKKSMLITGVSGLLGNNLAFYFRDKYKVTGCYNEHPVHITGVKTLHIDLTNKEKVVEFITVEDFGIIVHCASLTNVDQCEEEVERTYAVNVLSTRNLIESTDFKIKFVYISSDAVYNGKDGNYSEDDIISPKNTYGQSKYKGELEVEKKEGSLILRTNLFGWNIQNKLSLAEWIINELKSGREINGFQDAIFSTIYTFQMARVIDIALTSDIKGIYNCGGSDKCSKYEFALKIADKFSFAKKLVIPSLLDKHQFKAKRGRNLSLNVSRLEKDLNYKLPTIDQSIDEFYRDYKCGLPNLIKAPLLEKQEQWALIPYGRQWIDNEDVQEVVDVIKSTNLTQGPKIIEFEEKLCRYTGAHFSVACNSGTSALHMACLAAGVGPGDEIMTSPITFVASANCALYCGAKSVFADIDPRTYNISSEEIEKKITKNTKAIIPVHFAGQSCDMENIYEIIKRAEKKFGHKIFIIEDGCHALGSYYKSSKVGSCKFSDMVVMSFHPVKHITTGEGGIVFTNDKSLNKKLRQFRSHGITSDPEDFINKDLAFTSYDSPSMIQGSKNPWYYEQITIGYNYRITDIQCALGLSQLKKLEDFRKRRREIVDVYNEAFKSVEHIRTPFESPDCDSNFHLYVLLFEFENIRVDRAQFMFELKSRGIQTQVHYIPVHLQPFFRKNFKTNWGDCPNAEQYYNRCLSIPLYPAMIDNDVMRVISEIKIAVRGIK